MKHVNEVEVYMVLLYL